MGQATTWLRIVGLALWAAVSSAPTSAQDSPAARSRAVIERQFEAFARDDAQAAYALAAAPIRRTFGDADHFLAMVRDRYPAVYRHRNVEFGAFAELGDEASLRAIIVDRDNVVWTALYSLRREANGEWFISGCAVAKSDASAI